jgi:hypothetical protein
MAVDSWYPGPLINRLLRVGTVKADVTDFSEAGRTASSCDNERSAIGEGGTKSSAEKYLLME